jgi:outer membrane protein insertion porin family
VKVTPLPPDPSEPGYRDVLIELEETNTASVSFGALFSTDSGVLGQVQITQKNFDALDPPDSLDEFLAGRAWRGGGQTFSILLQPGNEVQNYSVSLVEPRAFDTDYSFSVEGFLRTRFYEDYDEQRLGGSFGLGRRLGERWNLSGTLRFENVDITEIDENATVDLFEVEGENQISSVGLRLTRTTYDEPSFPTQGSRIELSVERFGALGGDYDFTRLSAEHNIFLPLAEDFLGRRTVISFETRVAYIPEEDEAPIFERYYLGGRSLRGFQFRSVAPLGFRRDGTLSDDHVGGRFLFKFSPELRYPLVGDAIYGVVFVDSGIVTNEISLDPYRVAVGTGIRLKIPMFGPAPLAFDFAWPVMEADGDERRFFSFSVDIPF